MEFIEPLTKIQTLLTSVEQTVGPLAALQDRDKHASKISTVINQLRQHFLLRNYIQNNDKPELINTKMLRKINFFLILNSDLHYAFELKEDENVGHLVDVCPKISLCLLMEIIWTLKLDDFLYEFIVFGPVNLVLELLEPAIFAVQFSDPYLMLTRIQKLLLVIYQKICKLQKERVYYYTLPQAVNELQKNVIDLLQHYIKPSTSQMSSWEINELYRYTGYAAMYILELMLKYFDLYTSEHVSNIENEELESLFNFTYLNGAEIYQSPDKKLVRIKKCLDQINKVILVAIQANLSAINVTIFCSWVEFEVENTTKSIQLVVGNYAYLILEKLKNMNTEIFNDEDENFSTEIEQILQSVAIKPKTLELEMSSADLSSVLKNVCTAGPNQKEWFHRFVQFKEELWKDSQSVECLKKYIQLSDQNDVQVLLKSGLTAIEAHPENAEEIKLLLFMGLQQLPLEEQFQVVHNFFHDNSLQVYFNDPNLNALLTSTLNRTVTKNILINIPTLLLKNPEVVITSIFLEALKDVNHTDLIIEVLKSLKCLLRMEISVGEEHETVAVYIFKKICFENEQSFRDDRKVFHHFVEQIASNELINVADMTRRIFLHATDEALLAKDLERFEFYMSSCNVICTSVSFGSIYESFLIYLGTSLKFCERDITNFSRTAFTIKNVVIEMIGKILPLVLNSSCLKENEMNRLKCRLHTLPILNRFYFEKLLNPSTEINYFNYIWTGELKDRVYHWNIARMIQVLPFSTLNEWKLISRGILNELNDGIEMLKMFKLFLILICQVVEQSTTNTSLDCLSYCISTYSVIIYEIICPYISNSYNALLELWKSLMEVLSHVPNPIFESSTMSLMNVFVSILEEIKAKNESHDLKNFIESSLLNGLEISNILLQKFDLK